MDEALYRQQPFEITHTKNDNNSKALAIRQYKARVISQYAGK